MRFKLFIPPQLNEIQMITSSGEDSVERCLAGCPVIWVIKIGLTDIQVGRIAGHQHIWLCLTDHTSDLFA